MIKNKIIIPKGIKIGSACDDYTGVTVIKCDKGCVGGVDVRGGAPGTRETDLLRPDKAMQNINAVVLSGGSAYGLASTIGVMEYMRKRGIGYKIAGKVVPIVCGAVIFDLNDKEYHYPDAAMGEAACAAADTSLPSFGNTGAGKGATIGKIRGLKYASKGGLGAATSKVAGITVTAVVAVNSFGDVTDGKGNIIAGAKGKDGAFINTAECITQGKWLKLLTGKGGNTTIGCIITDAKLNKVEANKLASFTHNAFACHISPVHTDYDGDTVFVMATGDKKPLDFIAVQLAAKEAMGNAIVNAALSCAEYEIIGDFISEEQED
ncbi:MAG: P1 family peptidase [Clostridia bacterium]|nr:P1 family peptidase [Clostridia bacterium]